MKWILLASIIIGITLTTIPSFSIQDDTKATSSQGHLVNALGEEVSQVLVDEQVLIVADVTNGLDTQQRFVYIVQIQNNEGVVVSLGWLEGSLSPNQRLSPALSWIPENEGVHTATVFVWEAIDNPSALSPTLQIEIDVKLAGT